MSRSSSLKDYGVEEEIDPKENFNSLISVTVSTLMCLASKCPLPKPNVETTKLFLRTVTDDKGKVPRNVKGLLNLLNNYSGPYEADSIKEKCFEEPAEEKLMTEEEKPSVEVDGLSVPTRALDIVKETSPVVDDQTFVKRGHKVSMKKHERDLHKRGNKHLGSRISITKSAINNKTSTSVFSFSSAESGGRSYPNNFQRVQRRNTKNSKKWG